MRVCLCLCMWESVPASATEGGNRRMPLCPTPEVRGLKVTTVKTVGTQQWDCEEAAANVRKLIGQKHVGVSRTENKGMNVIDADKMSSRFCSAPTDLGFVVVVYS